MTGVMVQASASVEMEPQGPNVMTACRDTTGNKAVIVSMRTQIFTGFKSKEPEQKKCCSLSQTFSSAPST